MGERIFSFFLDSICNIAGVGFESSGEGVLLLFKSSLGVVLCCDKDAAERTIFSGSVERIRAQLKSFTCLVFRVDLKEKRKLMLFTTQNEISFNSS